MERSEVSENAGSVKTVEEAGRRFTEELLRRFHHDRPDEVGFVVLSEWVLPDQDSMRVSKAAKRR